MGVDIRGVFQRRIAACWEDVETHYDERRDYHLFAWLGDVCNGHYCTMVKPLSRDRGFPEDFVVSQDNRYDGRWYKAKNMGERNHSWLYAEEILLADSPRIFRTGVVSRQFYEQWDGVTAPIEYAADVAEIGRTVLNHPSDVHDRTTDVRIEWFVDGAESFGYFIDEVRRLKDQYREVRFVFGFEG